MGRSGRTSTGDTYLGLRKYGEEMIRSRQRSLWNLRLRTILEIYRGLAQDDEFAGIIVAPIEILRGGIFP